MLINKITTGILTASVFASSVVPAFAADVKIASNGNNSTSTVFAVSANVALVGQTSKTKANTAVINSGKTGKNSANANTGNGDTTVNSGDVSNTTTVTVTGGDNIATLPSTCGCGTDSSIIIAGNGNNSKNTVIGGNINFTAVGQTNKTTAHTVVINDGSTGGNTANGNTGAGDTTVKSGNVTNATTVTVGGGSNSL